MKNSIIYIILFTLTFSVANSQSQTNNNLINGMSFLGPHEPSIHKNTFLDLQATNANWIGLIPEAILDRETLTLKPDQENEHWGNTIEAQLEAIQLAKSLGLKVMLKPHIVLEKPHQFNFIIAAKDDKTHGAIWRGDFKAYNESDWEIWEANYENYIIELAEIAECKAVELFSIGTEMREFVVERPKFWNNLIVKVRKVYSGAITYSANWDEYQLVSFWDQLDFIGIDAYFPINKARTPTISGTINNWKSIKRKLKNLSRSNNKQILMTEFGYRNISYAGYTPWEHDDGSATPNNIAQVNLYEAFFSSFWKEEWVAGGFSWNWQQDLPNKTNTDFTIQNKPALSVIQKWYSPAMNF